MHQKHLLRFIKSKLRKEPGEVVIFRDGKYLTLQEVFESLKLTGYCPSPAPQSADPRSVETSPYLALKVLYRVLPVTCPSITRHYICVNNPPA